MSATTTTTTTRTPVRSFSVSGFQLEESKKDEPLYFCLPTDEQYGFLSQWYPSPFEVDGITYHTAEMWMMVGKARLFGDSEILEQMLRATEPAEHQALGRKVKGFERRVWDQHKIRIVEEGNWHKFTRSRGLARRLVATGERELVEASNTGRIWSIGFEVCDAEAHREIWGENLMGKTLMRVRERLRRDGYS